MRNLARGRERISTGELGCAHGESGQPRSAILKKAHENGLERSKPLRKLQELMTQLRAGSVAIKLR
ncbi:hypothetical protein DY000_02004181 [Brassica cretica]|uniref:Uncharacterized protein n=1 Tax=Brassica cretica TaxID=69181 RepID=A0ABQ7C064_BRACR|nr:hypothetical protein DY000_02004181 [Brassica cretica]